ncbi:MAG: hypothetical protein KDA91_24180 [Planctomycetaceae bacterium]|nr:hypothetical protein [Planctomycetaceae bacterium]
MLVYLLYCLVNFHPAEPELLAIDRIVKIRERDLALHALAVKAWCAGQKDLSRRAFSTIQNRGLHEDCLLTIAANRNPGEGAELYALLCNEMANDNYETQALAHSSYRRALFEARFITSLPVPDVQDAISSDVELITVDADPASMAQLLQPFINTLTQEAFIVPFLDEVYRRHGSERLRQLSAKLEIDDEVRQRLIAMALTKAIPLTWTEHNRLDPDRLVTDTAISTVVRSLDTTLFQKYSAAAIETRDLRTEALIQQAAPPAEYAWWLVEAAYIESMRGFGDLGFQYIEEAESRGAFSIRDIGEDVLTYHTDQVLCAIALCIEQARLGDPVGAIRRLRQLDLSDNVIVEQVLEIAAVSEGSTEDVQTLANELGSSDPFSAACLLIGRLGSKPTIPRSRWTNATWAHSLINHAEQNWEWCRLGFESRIGSEVAAVSLPTDGLNRLLLLYLAEGRSADALNILCREDIVTKLPSETIAQCLDSESHAVSLAACRCVLGDPLDCHKTLRARSRQHLIELATQNQRDLRYAALATLVSSREESAAPILIPPIADDNAETEFLIYLLSGSSVYQNDLFDAALESSNSWLKIIAARELRRIAVTSRAASVLANKHLVRQRKNIVQKILSADPPVKDLTEKK